MIHYAQTKKQEPDEQIPLFKVNFNYEDSLESLKDNDWYNYLLDFNYLRYSNIAVDYYHALYTFNKSSQSNHLEAVNNKGTSSNVPESREAAQQRLLFERATMDSSKPKLFTVTPSIITDSTDSFSLTEDQLGPWIVPSYLIGRKPKCFFAQLKAFLGTIAMGRPGTAEEVYHNLTNNPVFAQECGFSLPHANGTYNHRDIPKLRTLEQFDQIMREAGLWDKIKKNEIFYNITTGVIKKEEILVHDTTHYHGYSEFVTIEYVNEKGKIVKKSQCKATKICGCADKQNCSHEWVLTDDGCGTVVKSNGRMYWAHKAAIMSLANQGVVLDAVAVADAATNDGQTFYEHIVRLFEDYPELQDWISHALADAAYDDKTIRKKLFDKYGIVFRTSINPKRRQSIIGDDLPCGMEKLTPFGNLYCENGYEMEYKGTRILDEKFIYSSPCTSDGKPVCLDCSCKQSCSPYSKTGRTVQIDFDLLSGIDPNDPPMAKRFKAMMKFRPSVERVISVLKKQLGDDRLTIRTNNSFQALLDKTLIVYHQLLRQ